MHCYIYLQTFRSVIYIQVYDFRDLIVVLIRVTMIITIFIRYKSQLYKLDVCL
jgi:hypothetical protein